MKTARCGYHGCFKTAESVGKSLSRCANCGMVRYCSKECQKASWKAGGVKSHKRFCPTFKKLKSLIPQRDEHYEIPIKFLGTEDLPYDALMDILDYLNC
jgi:sulfatase maturation enzyme AslB (radical SAM superfamily)